MKLAPLIGLILCLVAPRALGAIAFDSTAGHSKSQQLSTSPSALTVTIVSGESGLLVAIGSASSSVVTSISGGGTWTQIGSTLIDSGADRSMELWTNGVGGGATASSITITFVDPNTDFSVLQYTGVSSINSAGRVTNTGSSTLATISLSTTAGNSFVVAGMGNTDGDTVTAGTGTLRLNTLVGAAVGDNTLGATTGICTNSMHLSATDTWLMMAVELLPPSATPQQTMMGAGQ